MNAQSNDGNGTNWQAIKPNFAPTTYLVNSPNATQFLELAETNTGGKVLLGDHEKMDPQAGSAALNAQIFLRNSIADIKALATDVTRNEYERHEAGKVLAGRVVEKIESAKAIISRRSNELFAAAENSAEEGFTPKLGREQLDAETRLWIRERAKEDDGITRFRDELKKDKNFAAIIYNAPAYLLGINSQVHETMKMEAVQRHLPDAYRAYAQHVELSQLGEKYTKVARDVRLSFYNESLAELASKRVLV